VAFSHLILDSYGAIFGSCWLWRGLQESELTTSVAVLQGLATRDAAGAMSRIHGVTMGSAANSVRALVKLDLVVMENGRPRLSMKGRSFLDVNA
jgi:hypothetical protein